MKLTDQLLIAVPHRTDENDIFAGSVVYVCDHSDNGAMGIIINKRSPITLDTVFSTVGKTTPPHFRGQPILLGGPIQTERGFVLHTPIGNWQSSLTVTDRIALTTSRDVIDGLQEENAVENVLLTIGYAGWAAGQLEQEIANNVWLTAPADENILFHLPSEERQTAAFAKLGIRPENFIDAVGHA